MYRNYLITAVLFLLCLSGISQVADRYNFVQKPTETSVLIAWRTSTPAIGTVQWGTDPLNLNNVLSNPNATSKHAFDITGLTPNTRYYYQTSTDGGFTSSVDNFFTAKPIEERQLSFLHYGDCGYDNSMQHDIAALMLADSGEFAVVAGDVDQGQGDNYDDIFFGVYKDILKQRCHYTAIGNHDTYHDNAATYLDAFYLPTNNPQGSERYYSFYWGNTKFICLDSNIPYDTGSDQYNWLEDELQCNDRQWLFVFFHHPPWTNAWDPLYYVPFQPYFQYEGNEDMRTEIVPLFEQYNVDYVLNGHSHCYQRGAYNGVQYVISGGAGSTTLDFNTNSNAPNIQMEIYENHYVKFNIEGDTAYYRAINKDGNEIDSVATIKPFVPIIPEISYTAPTLSSTSGTTYQWYLDGVAINGANAQTFNPTQSGVYEVITTNAYGCEFTSEPYSIVITSTDNASLENLSVYPNPTFGELVIAGHIGNSLSKELSITVFSALGTIVKRETVNSAVSLMHKMDISDAANGIYFVEIGHGNKRLTKRISKQ